MKNLFLIIHSATVLIVSTSVMVIQYCHIGLIHICYILRHVVSKRKTEFVFLLPMRKLRICNTDLNLKFIQITQRLSTPKNDVALLLKRTYVLSKEIG